MRLGEGALTLKAFTRALESDILWARIRAGAYLSYCGREELRPMQPLIPILQSAMRNRRIFGPEHDDHIKTHLMPMLDAQRDVIGRGMGSQPRDRTNPLGNRFAGIDGLLHVADQTK